jgi:hypothetical protein
MFDIYKEIDAARLSRRIRAARLNCAPLCCRPRIILELNPEDARRLHRQTGDIIQKRVLDYTPCTYARDEPVPDPDDMLNEHLIDTYEDAEIRITPDVPEGKASVLVEIGD